MMDKIPGFANQFIWKKITIYFQLGTKNADSWTSI